MSGRFWPGLRLSTVSTVNQDKVKVRYDDGQEENVRVELVQPTDPSPFGTTEIKALQVGEFCEVCSESKENAGHRFGKVTKVNKTTCTVEFPFCDGSAPESIKVSSLSRSYFAFRLLSETLALVD